MKHTQQLPLRLLYPVLLPTIVFSYSMLGAETEDRRAYGFSEAFFEVLLDGRRTSEHVILTVRVVANDTAACSVEAQAVFLAEDPSREGAEISLRSFSTRDTSITGARLAGDTLQFDLLLDGRDADRKVRVRSIRPLQGGGYGIKATGLWSDQTHTSFVRAQWRQVEHIELRHPRLLPKGKL